MKKIRNIILSILGILICIISIKFDSQVKLFFNDPKSPLLSVPLSIITNFGFIFVVMLIIPIFMLFNKNKRAVYKLLITFLLSFILNFFVKLIVQRPRPLETLTYPIIHILDYSFPSTHSVVVFAMLPVLIKYLQKQKYLWVAIAFLVAFSRIYFNFHFLSDVVFGAFFGYFIGYSTLNLLEGYNGKNKRL